MKLTGFKLKDRVRRVIIKLLEKEVDLDNIIRKTSGGDQDGEESSIHNIESLC